MFTVRSIFSGVLIVLMLMTSGAMASVRGMTHTAAGTMILCTGNGAVKVLIDADGAPIELSHVCPDCAMTFAAAFPIGFTADVFMPPRSSEYGGRDQSLSVSRHGAIAVARGPPRV
jgi:hypothetical protein